jgi:hypothetical protein
MTMPKEWTDKIEAHEEQKKLEADKIHNLPNKYQQQIDSDKEAM